MAQKHIEFLDVEGTGIKKEVVVVKKWDNGVISYIDLAKLDKIDRARMKQVLSHPGASNETVQLYQIMATITLSNGLNALDYFHSNFTKQYRPVNFQAQVGGALDGVDTRIVSTTMIGSEFANPAEAVIANDVAGRF
jgi:hypothetical protein